jgi:hypothetical protein
MKTHSFDSALERHAEIASSPVTVTQLIRNFQPEPRTSSRALLTKMGPFEAISNPAATTNAAFRFKNRFPITAEIAVQYLHFAETEVVNDVIRFGADLYSDALSSIKIPLPLGKKVSLPDAIFDEVINRVILELSATIVDAYTDPVGKSFGRCGGMAFAGYDFYHQGWPVDAFGSSIPEDGTPLDKYILERLLDSLDLNARTFLEWVMILHLLPHIDNIATEALFIAAGSFAFPIGPALALWIGPKTNVFHLGGSKPLLDKTKDEWQTIKEKLDEEAAWPIGLVYGDRRNLFNQHQVLAIGYKDTGLGTAKLFIWDNNKGAETTTVSLDFRGDRLMQSGIVDKDGNDRVLRGIFHEAYSPQKPPSSLHLS